MNIVKKEIKFRIPLLNPIIGGCLKLFVKKQVHSNQYHNTRGDNDS